MPLKAGHGCDLNTIAQAVNADLKSVSEDSFVEESKPDPRKAALEVSLEILKDVIKTKQDANKAERERGDRLVQKRKILDAINAKKDEKLTNASADELQKMLAELPD